MRLIVKNKQIVLFYNNLNNIDYNLFASKLKTQGLTINAPFVIPAQGQPNDFPRLVTQNDIHQFIITGERISIASLKVGIQDISSLFNILSSTDFNFISLHRIGVIYNYICDCDRAANTKLKDLYGINLTDETEIQFAWLCKKSWNDDIYNRWTKFNTTESNLKELRILSDVNLVANPRRRISNEDALMFIRFASEAQEEDNILHWITNRNRGE